MPKPQQVELRHCVIRMLVTDTELVVGPDRPAACVVRTTKLPGENEGKLYVVTKVESALDAEVGDETGWTIPADIGRESRCAITGKSINLTIRQSGAAMSGGIISVAAVRRS